MSDNLTGFRESSDSVEDSTISCAVTDTRKAFLESCKGELSAILTPLLICVPRCSVLSDVTDRMSQIEYKVTDRIKNADGFLIEFR
jgi:hypothetical protein